MTKQEAQAVGRYLERALGTANTVRVSPSPAGRPAMVEVGGAFIGTLDRDDDDGEVSYALTAPILAGDSR